MIMFKKLLSLVLIAALSIGQASASMLLTGVGSNSSGGTVPSYANLMGYGDRTAGITVTSTAALGGGTLTNLVDDDFAATAAGSIFFTAAQSTRELVFNFGSRKVATQLIWWQNTVASHGTWVVEGSNDNSAYSQLGSSFTLGNTSQLQQIDFANTTAYQYYRLRQTAGTTSGTPWILEVWFKLFDPTLPDASPYASGDRQLLITTTSNFIPPVNAGAITELVDGSFVAAISGSTGFINGESTRRITFELLLGKVATGFRWVQNTTTSHGTWTISGSADNVSYTPLGSSFTLGGNYVLHQTFANGTSYKYYRLDQTAGTVSATPWLVEIELDIAADQ